MLPHLLLASCFVVVLCNTEMTRLCGYKCISVRYIFLKKSARWASVWFDVSYCFHLALDVGFLSCWRMLVLSTRSVNLALRGSRLIVICLSVLVIKAGRPTNCCASPCLGVAVESAHFGTEGSSSPSNTGSIPSTKNVVSVE